MRYGLYFAPGANEAFHDLGASWLGRDAASGHAVEHPDLDGAFFRAFDYQKWEAWARLVSVGARGR